MTSVDKRHVTARYYVINCPVPLPFFDAFQISTAILGLPFSLQARHDETTGFLFSLISLGSWHLTLARTVCFCFRRLFVLLRLRVVGLTYSFLLHPSQKRWGACAWHHLFFCNLTIVVDADVHGAGKIAIGFVRLLLLVFPNDFFYFPIIPVL